MNSTDIGGVAPSDEWAEAERVRDLPAVDDAIRNFLIDSTGDNSTAVVREILRAAGVSASGGATFRGKAP